MNRKQEQEIDRLEAALDQLDEGATQDDVAEALDPETAALFTVAARLAHELPDGLPDPAFRERLKQDLLTANPPVNLTTRRVRSFFYDWRFGVAAASLAAIVLIVVIYGAGALKGTSPEPPARETVVSALSVAKETTEPGTTATPEVVTDTKVLPPIDADHVVSVPLGLGAAGPLTSTPGPQPTPGIELSASLPDLPQTAPTWLLTGPESAETFLQTLIARVGITGEIQPAPNEGQNAFVVVDTTGFPAIHWNQSNAFFRYDRGPNEPTPPSARATTDAILTAKDWLSEIGFDLTSITYKASLEDGADQTIVQFDPTDLPDTAIPPGIGVTIGVGPNGSIQFAQGFWLSLGESADVPIRTSQETLDAARNGEWYSQMPASETSRMSMTVSSMTMSYLLTRADDSSYLLQPVVTLAGQRWTPEGEVQDNVYVSAVKK